ncbi:hypothetical protein [Aestuariicoccus sp. MJ-SS9]|uniref:hypothetical protein n=1 Tax=Aestuariicoccus sp. MJ-SS9 TaxID=3079855 RepID=UPI002913F8F8|nr:hypothetical protein [Aestuariicoccus sp. MJ-SS9]MDU8913109.1 hypothetical protein [Aestuariicoccus sp. MJ-SS9]
MVTLKIGRIHRRYTALGHHHRRVHRPERAMRHSQEIGPPPSRRSRYARLFALHRQVFPTAGANAGFQEIRVVSPQFARFFQQTAIASLMAPKQPVTPTRTED